MKQFRKVSRIRKWTNPQNGETVVFLDRKTVSKKGDTMHKGSVVLRVHAPEPKQEHRCDFSHLRNAATIRYR